MTKQEILDLIQSVIFENTAEDITAVELKSILDALADGYIEPGTLGELCLLLTGGTMLGDIAVDTNKILFTAVGSIYGGTKHLYLKNTFGTGTLVDISQGKFTVYGDTTTESNNIEIDNTNNDPTLTFHRVSDGSASWLRHEVGGGNEWVLPAATGTIALISDIAAAVGDYLPLAGGTVTGNVFLDVDDEQGLMVRNLAGAANLVEVWNATSTEGYVAVKNSATGEYIHINPEKLGLHNNTFVLNIRAAALSQNEDITFPAASGTVALISDIATAVGDYLPLVGGTMAGDIVFPADITLSDGVVGGKRIIMNDSVNGGTLTLSSDGTGYLQSYIVLDTTSLNMAFSDGSGGGWFSASAVGATMSSAFGVAGAQVLTFTSASMLIDDGVNLKGLEYLLDYSANYTARSLVDKGYVDSNIITAPLTGYVSGAGTVNASDTILQAIQKLNGNTALLTGAVVYQGTWNASTNSPALASGVGTKGHLYKVSVAGTTTIDGQSQWEVGDAIVFNGTTYDRIDGGTTEVTTVHGRVGAVVGAAADYSGVAMIGITSLNGLIIAANTGVITTGVWNGTAITDAYILSAATWNAKLDGSGTTNYISKWNAGALTSSQIQDNGSTLSIGVAPASQYNFYVRGLSTNYMLVGENIKVTSGSNAVGVFGSSGGGGSTQSNIGVIGSSANNTLLNVGVQGTTSGSSAVNVGGHFNATGATNNYCLKLTDGTQAAGKFLKSVTAGGEANWASIVTADVTESTNLYFTNARAIASTLTSYSSGAGTITAADSILQAIQKLDGNITAKNSDWNTVSVTRTSTSTFTVTDNATNQEAFKAGRALKYKVNGVNTYRYGQVSSYVTGTVTIIGYELTASIEEMNWGLSSKVVTETITVSGAYADGTTNTLILDDNASYTRWKNTKARLVGIDAINVTAETGATKPVINVKNGAGNSIFGTGITITAASTWYGGGVTIETAVGTYYEINRNDSYELAVTTQGTNGTALDLTVVLIFILE